MRTLLGLMLGGRLVCWWTRHHQWTETLIGFEPTVNGQGTAARYHVNCLRCPQSFDTHRTINRNAS